MYVCSEILYFMIWAAGVKMCRRILIVLQVSDCIEANTAT